MSEFSIADFFYKALFFCSLCSLSACAVLPRGNAADAVPPVPPDYSNPAYWAALPDKADPADRTPAGLSDMQASAPADVFFLHPTTYTGDRGHNQWNAPVNDARLNRKTDESTILYQASLFNGVGRVFAPRYRQAHLHSYYARNAAEKAAAEKAFELAWLDVKAAFEYYLAHHHQGRPIIIASHSQGTTHAKRLMREFFDGKPLQERLVAAYLVGIPVEKDYLKSIPPCQAPDDTGCYCTWRSFRKGHIPKWHKDGSLIAVTNPLTWTTGEAYAPAELNEGGVLYNFDKILPKLADAQIHDGLLWVTKPRFPGSVFFTRPNYHVADYNFYYLNVRNNAMRRVEAFRQADRQG